MGCANTKESDERPTDADAARRGTGANLKFVEMIFKS